MKHSIRLQRALQSPTGAKPGLAARRPRVGLAALLIGIWGCSSTETAPSQEPADDVVPQVEVPPADGPKLVALRPGLVVRDRPSMKAGVVLGTLRAGAQVARSVEAYSKKGCEGGWYTIRPKGWVCVGPDASLDVDSPLARVLTEAPNLERPLPYRYGRVRRGAAVVYGTLPSTAEQLAAEPKLSKQKALEDTRLGTGANDVPLDGDSGMPTGPPVLMPEAEGVGADGYRTTRSFFVFDDKQQPPPPLTVGIPLSAEHAGKTEVLRPKSGVAITRSFMVGQGDAARRFAVMPDGRFIGVDRLKPTLATAWHGLDISKIGLPVAFTLRAGVCPYELDGTKKAERLEDEEFAQREAVPLTGRFRTVNGVRYYFTRAKHWLRHKDIILIPKRNKMPDFVAEGQKWLDVSLANQSLVAWQGKKPLFATLISSGQDRLGDPKEGPATAQGVFRITSKHVTRAVDDREVGQAYRVGEVPWVAEFAEGFAITGSYWLQDLGEARSYHNVALAPVDAHWLWHWSDPQVPDGWHGVVVGEDDPSTVVYTHR